MRKNSLMRPIGNRRTPVHRRHVPLNQPHPSHEMPVWSAYLDRLGEQTQHVQGAKLPSGVVEEQASSKQDIASLDARESVESGRAVADPQDGGLDEQRHTNRASSDGTHPIGNRRTGAEQRLNHNVTSSVCDVQQNAEEIQAEADGSYLARISLGIWGYYFIAKLGKR